MNECTHQMDPKTEKTNLWLPEERGRGDGQIRGTGN